MASILAMLYLIVFATLAVGFVCATNISAQVGADERDIEQATISANSGMQYMRYRLATLVLPYGTNNANLLSNVAAQLNAAMSCTADMGDDTVTVSNGVIYIPSQTGWISDDVDLNSRFQAKITQSGSNLIVTTHGSTLNSSGVRGAQLLFAPASYALIGLDGLTLTRGHTDSYDATRGPYSATTAGHHGSIASNGNIALSDRARVDGNARFGIGKTIAAHDGSTIIGEVMPLQSHVAMKSVGLPAIYADLGDVILSSGSLSLGAGVYRIGKLDLSGTAKLNWTGPVQIYIANSYSITGNAQMNTYQNIPANRTLYFLPTCPAAVWSGNNICFADVHAPDTDFSIGGNVELFGRLTARRITSRSTGGFHGDQSLPPCGIAGFVPVADSCQQVP